MLSSPSPDLSQESQLLLVFFTGLHLVNSRLCSTESLQGLEVMLTYDVRGGMVSLTALQ